MEVVEKELPEGWEWIKLDDIIEEYISGGTPATTNQTYWDGVIPWTRSANISSKYLDCGERFVSETAVTETATNIVKNGNVLVATRVGVGKSAVNLIDVAISQDLTGLIVDKSRIFPQYLVNFLHSPAMQCYFNQFSRGTTIKGIQRSDLVRIPIPLPPLETQRKIVAILEKAEATQRLRAEADALTQELVQSVFMEMFGDPVTNPMGWAKLKIGQITDYVSSGITPRGGREIYVNNGVKFIRSQNIRMNHIVYDDIAYITKNIHNQMSRTWVKNNDVLLNITGASIGRIAWYNGLDDEANVNQHVCILRPKKSTITPEFLSYQISMPSYQNRMLSLQSGATRQAFNYAQIKNFEIIVPSIGLQQHFSRLVEQTNVILERQFATKMKIKTQFNALSQKAFTGELIT